jgi:hypothetical protein
MPIPQDQSPATKQDIQDLIARAQKSQRRFEITMDRKLIDHQKRTTTDLQGVKEEIYQKMNAETQVLYNRMSKEMQQLAGAILNTMQLLFQEQDARTEDKIAAAEGRMLTCMEGLRHDVVGMLKDIRSNDGTVADHGRRIRRLEKHAGMAA